MHVSLFVLLPAALSLSAATWTVDDILLFESASSLEISRDGTMAVWTQSRMDKKKGETVSQLYLHYFADGYQAQLTRGDESAQSPRFSPDGRKIAFLSTRPAAGSVADEKDEKKEDEKTAQVWLLDLRGGEPEILTDFKKGVKDVHWLDSGALLLTAPEDPSLYEISHKERKDTSKVVDDEAHEPPVRLFRFDLKQKEARRLTTNTDWITHTFVSPDGRWAVTTHERSLQFEYNSKVRPATFLRDLKNNTVTQLFSDGRILPRDVRFTPDSSGFYFSAPYSSHPIYLMASISRLYYWDLGAGRHTEVDLDWDRGLASDFEVTPAGVFALLAGGVRHRAALYARQGNSWTRRWVEGTHAANLFGLATSLNSDRVVYHYSTAAAPGRHYSALLANAALVDVQPVTRLNSHLDGKTLARTEVVAWKGARGDEVEGILYYPHNYEAGKKYALVLMIHGGPHGADYDAFEESVSTPHQLFAQRGAFILKPNYHGSSDYGLAWAESIGGGQYNELEWVDCERGVDAMIARGLADPDKLGVMGWSNGAIITIELTTRTTRYKAASAGAGDVNWISDWGNCQFGHSFDDYYLGASPLADPQLYLRKSPLFRMDKVTTPTIIFFGTEDRQVPTEQGWQHYRALQHLGQTATRFILFPGEGHGPRKYGHRHRKLTEELRWFDRHLFGTEAPANEALPPASPLAAALRIRAAGDIPETVERGALRIGRFEVTRAQFAAFRPAYSYPAGAALLPANNISFDDAKAYCEWLSRRTGRKFRLGTEKEMRPFLKASARENTLDAWAGYAINADDAARLAELAKQVEPDGLLRPVGSYPGDGEDPIYDLGGNVAEWVTTEDGAGIALGGSADRPADSKAASPAAPAFIGFRVVESR